MRRADARVYAGPDSFVRNQVTLAVRDDNGYYLMSDGTWRAFSEGEVATDMGIALPAHVIEAIGVAIQEWQGHTSHADTEARVLREWLAVERERVDRTLAVPR